MKIRILLLALLCIATELFCATVEIENNVGDRITVIGVNGPLVKDKIDAYGERFYIAYDGEEPLCILKALWLPYQASDSSLVAAHVESLPNALLSELRALKTMNQNQRAELFGKLPSSSRGVLVDVFAIANQRARSGGVILSTGSNEKVEVRAKAGYGSCDFKFSKV